MPAILNQRAIGALANREAAESALNELKHSDFPMDKISVVARDASEGDEIASRPEEFIQDKSIKGVGTGILAGGALGSFAGLLTAGLTALAVPGLGSIALAGAAGAFAGGYYGAAGGGILGGVFGNGVSKEQVRLYSDRLSQGNYLIMVDGTDDDIRRAESILSRYGIQDWGVYSGS